MSRRLPKEAYVGDELGLLKVVDLSDAKSSQPFISHGSADMKNGIEFATWTSTQKTSGQLLVGYKTGTLEYRKSPAESSSRIPAFQKNYAGISVLRHEEDNLKLLCGDIDGTIQLRQLSLKDGEGFGFAAEPVATYKAPPKMCRVRVDEATHTKFATAGEEHLLRIWDAETGKETYRSKNVHHDKLNLRCPYWVTDLHFVPGSSDVVLSTTANHEIRLNDARSSAKRPALDISIGEHAIRCSTMIDTQSVIIGDAGGVVSLVDLKKGKLVTTFRGSRGAIRSLAVHSDTQTLGTVGLDRYLRLYDIPSRKLIKKVYLKQKLNTLVFSEAVTEIQQASSSSSSAADAETDGVWAQLDQNAARTKRKTPDTTSSAPAAIAAIPVVVDKTASSHVFSKALPIPSAGSVSRSGKKPVEGGGPPEKKIKRGPERPPEVKEKEAEEEEEGEDDQTGEGIEDDDEGDLSGMEGAEEIEMSDDDGEEEEEEEEAVPPPPKAAPASKKKGSSSAPNKRR